MNLIIYKLNRNSLIIFFSIDNKDEKIIYFVISVSILILERINIFVIIEQTF